VDASGEAPAGVLAAWLGGLAAPCLAGLALAAKTDERIGDRAALALLALASGRHDES
jgi:hypothetical protein